MDGSRPAPLPVDLEAIEAPAVRTRTDVVRGPASREPTASCLELWDRNADPVSVVRVGVQSESVTFREYGRTSVFACDNAPGSRENDRRWCGTAYGPLDGGRLRDPRVDLLCTTKDRDTVGFVWIEPGRRTRYVAVSQSEFVEVYEVVAGLPVRVATATGVDPLRHTVGLEVTEHEESGRLLRRYGIDAAVAG